MAGTFTCLKYHITFSTKDRRPSITREMQLRLFEYLGGMIRERRSILYEIGGVADHIHMLVRLHPSLAVASFLRELKSSSSGWIHRTFPDERSFAWQEGYGAFSVSQSQVDKVGAYIQNQFEHHKRYSFQDEFRGLLRAHEIDYDETTIWQ